MNPRGINRHYGGSDHEWSRLFEERRQRLADRLRARQQNCPACGELWPASDLEMRHDCPGARIAAPSMFLTGRRLSRAPISVGIRTQPEDWVVHAATEASVNERALEPLALPELLATQDEGTFQIRLRNGLTEEQFTVIVTIATSDDLDLVDDAAWRLAHLGVVRPNVDAFIEECSEARSARHYVDGLSSYFFGVMDRNGEPAARGHVALFESAAVALAQYRRAPAALATGLVAFYLNTFDAGYLSQGAPTLEATGLAAARFRAALRGQRPDLEDRGDLLPPGAPESLMADKITHAVLLSSLSSLATAEQPVEQSTRHDRFKLNILAAERSLRRGDLAGAKQVASRYRNDPAARVWAESIFEADVASAGP